MQASTFIGTNNYDMDDSYYQPGQYNAHVIDASSNDIAIDLTYNNYFGQYYTLYRIDNSTYNVTITPKTGFTINGSSSSVSLNVGETMELLCISTDWRCFKYAVI